MKKSIIIGSILIAALALTTAGCGAKTDSKEPAKPAAQANDGKKIVLKLGHGVTTSNTIHTGLEKFAKTVSEKTNGQVEIKIFPNMQLGQERDMVEGLQLGTVDMTMVSTGPLGGFVPAIGVVDLPFLFNSNEHAYKVLDGEVGQGILKQFESKGMVGLSFFENGWRHISTSKKKVITPADLKGMKIRTMENKVHIASFKALGAAPTPMVWGEVYTSLQQGVIDGQENPSVILATNALWEVQKYYALTGHFYTPQVFLMSKKTLDKLPAETQKIIKDAALEAAKYQRDLSQKQDNTNIELLKSKGMEVYNVDRKAFQDATKSVYSEFESTFGKDLIEKIAAAGK